MSIYEERGYVERLFGFKCVELKQFRRKGLQDNLVQTASVELTFARVLTEVGAHVIDPFITNSTHLFIQRHARR